MLVDVQVTMFNYGEIIYLNTLYNLQELDYLKLERFIDKIKIITDNYCGENIQIILERI